MSIAKQKKQLVPQLRFPEFDGKWVLNRVGKSLNMKAGSFVSAKKIKIDKMEYDYPCYGGNGLRGYTKSFNNEGKFSLIGRQGALCGNVNLVEGKFHATEHAVVVKHNKDFDTDFVYYTLINLKLNRYATGQAQPGLSISNIESIKFAFPPLPEQQKIANFLSSIDTQLQTLEKKKEALEQYKKGVTQKIFKQEIRFKDDDGNAFPEWEKCKLLKTCDRVTQKNKIDNQNVLTISAQMGLVNQLDYFNRSVSSKNLKGYYLLHKNDFAYNKSYSNGYPMGAIKRLKYYEKGVVSTLYICFRFKKIVSFEFMEQYFDSGLQNKEIKKVAQEGARNHGLLNIGVNDFFDMKLSLPSIEEQTKIANFLSSIDQQIEAISQQIQHTKSYKKGLLQQMFV